MPRPRARPRPAVPAGIRRDTLTAHPHEPDIQALMKMCDVHGVPLGTNVASAEILLRSPSQATYWGRDAAATHT